MADTPIFEKLALIGIGLIRSSIARRTKIDGLANEVAIATRSESTLKRARELELGAQWMT